MNIPLTYNLRNLTERRSTTIMTALGVGLTVAVLLAAMALGEGLSRTFAVSGHALNILAVRKGATTEMFSNFPRTTFQDLKFKQGIARTSSGEPFTSLELVTVITLESAENPDGTNVNFRGVTPLAIDIRGGLAISEGRWFQTGRREVVVGRSIAARYPGARMGSKLRFGRGEWEVVGVMDSGESAVNSEIFADLNQLATDNYRPEVMTSALIRATDEVSMTALIHNLGEDQRLDVDAMPEKEYYRRQTISAAPVRFLGMLIAGIMSVGSCFAAMNTMYAAVSRRSREVGTLRVLGFNQGEILLSFLIESLLVSFIGGMLGCLLILPLNNLTSGIGSFTTFNETSFQFRITPDAIGLGMLFGLLMGAAGGLLPARSAARLEILAALRSV